jgi:predicted phosphate transport protein (TIGR00153 family)
MLMTPAYSLRLWSFTVRFRLTPTDQTFFELLAVQASHLVAGAEALQQMLGADFDAKVDLAAQIREIEHHADDATHTIIRRLNSTFVTPFDRDDIYNLSSALDDCMDFMEEAADLIVLYRIDKAPKKISKQITILRRAADLTAEAMPKLRSLENLADYWVEINRLENQADRAYRALLADLFSSETDAIHVMKLKELIEALEHAADAFERVANTVETIALKES